LILWQRYVRTVLPKPLDRVVDAFLGQLNVHDQVPVIKQHPAVLSLALPAKRLGTEFGEGLLDGIDNGANLTFISRRAQQEDVGDHELRADIKGDQVLGELV